MVNSDEETEQLNKYPEQVALQEKSVQVSTLRNGYLPDPQQALAEAGIRCIPLINNGDMEITEAALDRLQGIVFKIKSQPSEFGTRDVLRQLETLLQQHQAQDKKDALYGFITIFVLAAFIFAIFLLITHWLFY